MEKSFLKNVGCVQSWSTGKSMWFRQNMTMKKSKKPIPVVDVFAGAGAGAGGLGEGFASCSFKRNRRFDIRVSVDNAESLWKTLLLRSFTR